MSWNERMNTFEAAGIQKWPHYTFLMCNVDLCLLRDLEGKITPDARRISINGACELMRVGIECRPQSFSQFMGHETMKFTRQFSRCRSCPGCGRRMPYGARVWVQVIAAIHLHSQHPYL